MKKKEIFIDMYGVTDVYKLNRLMFFPESEFLKRKKENDLKVLVNNENTDIIYPKDIINANKYCHLICRNLAFLEVLRLSNLYELNFLSTPFRDFPNKYSEVYKWFLKRTDFTFADNIVLSYRNDIAIDYFQSENNSLFKNGAFNEFHILFEEDELINIRNFIYTIEE